MLSTDEATERAMTMLARPCPGRLPLSPAVLAFALVLMAPVPASVARAEDAAAQASLQTEASGARVELDATMGRMTTASRRVRDMLRDARKRGTRRQVACVDDALSRADVARRAARTQASEALAAYERSDLTSARAARARVVELDEAQRLAVRDGAACLPRPVAERVTPGTVVHVVVDPAIPDVKPELPPL
jgi:hypothetical protein